MLSAQKEDTRLIPDAARSDSPPLGSFGKVVDSIQGLQERLDNFSADDIGGTHDTVQTLLLRLSNLQQKLTTLAEIKVYIAAARDIAEAALSECADAEPLDASETCAFIQTLTQANKLIPFPRSNKAAKAPGPRLALDSDKLERQEVAVSADDAPILSASKEHEDVDASERPALINIDAVNLQSTAQPDIATGTVAGEENDSEDQQPSQIAELSPAMPLAPFLTTDSKPVVADHLQADICESAASEISSASAQPTLPLDLPEETATTETSKDPVAITASPEFDQRLLDDLIKNYGEFLVTQSSPRTGQATDTFVIDEPEAAVTVANVQPNDREIERQNLPSTKTNGDLDRQLKQLIKDYGEYDLYSRQSPLNLKTGVIAAFLLLALIFSGFYYFSPKTVLPEHLNAPTGRPSSVDSSDQGKLTDRPSATAPATDALHTTENNSRPKLNHKEKVK